MITDSQFKSLVQRLQEFDPPSSRADDLESLWGEDDGDIYDRGMDAGYDEFAQELRKMLDV